MQKFSIQIFAAILAYTVANLSFAANWRLIFKTNNAEIYIDQSSISNSGAERTVVIKSNEIQGERSPSSLELKYLVNCVANEVALVGARQFKSLDLQGDATTLNTSNPPKPIEAKPGTAASAYVKAACEQPRVSPPNPLPTQATQAPQRQAPPTQTVPKQNSAPQPAPAQSAPMTMSDIICQTHEMVMLNQILPFRQQGIMGVGEAQKQFNSEDDAGTRVFLKQYVRQLYADPAWGEKTLRSGQFVKACAKVHRGY